MGLVIGGIVIVSVIVSALVGVGLLFARHEENADRRYAARHYVAAVMGE